MRKMAGAIDGLEPGVRNERAIAAAVRLADHAIVRAPEEQCWNANAVQPAFQPRIMEIRTPGKARGGFAGARRGGNFGRRQGFVVAPPSILIAIGDFEILRFGEREDVGDVAGLAIAELDADGIGHDQTRKPHR